MREFNYHFNIRQKMGGIVLEVNAQGTSFFANEFYGNERIDELNEEGISNAFLRIQKRLQDELNRDGKIL